jgi:type IV secretory pathway VirJ component
MKKKMDNNSYRLFSLLGLVMLFCGFLSSSAGSSAQHSGLDSASALAVTPQQELENNLHGLPLVEVATGIAGRNVLAIIISGDGGWTEIDRQLGKSFAASGIPVVGLNSLKYFWHEKPPEIAAHDLENIINHYASRWGKNSVLLIGYSFGADTLPFMASRLPKDLLSRVQLIVLLGPSENATFEFRLSDWVNDALEFLSLPEVTSIKLTSSPTPEQAENKAAIGAFPVQQEVEKMPQIRFLCVYGEQEKASLCPSLNPAQVTSVRVKGGHHFDRQYKKVAETIVKAIKQD